MTSFGASLRKQSQFCLNVVLVSLYLLKSEASRKEKPKCGLKVAFDSKVTRSCNKIIDIIKLEVTL